MRKKKIFGICCAAMLLFAVPSMAFGQTCITRSDALAELSKKYSETPIWMGLSNGGGVIELLVKEDGTTWSIIVTMPDGRTCMLSVGKIWEKIMPATGPEA